MTEKKLDREIAFASTYDEIAKNAIERALLKHGVSYLIKIDKVRDKKLSLFESRKKYSYYINRYQEEEARLLMQEDDLPIEVIEFLL